MATATESPLRTIPESRAVRAALARNLREARLLRRLLRLAQAADEERRQSKGATVIRASEPLDTPDVGADTDVDRPQAAAQIGDTLPDLGRLAVDAAGVARLLSVSERHVWGLHSSGRLPLPVRLGRRLAWSVDDLRDWLLAGAPPREKWQAQKDEPRTAHGAR